MLFRVFKTTHFCHPGADGEEVERCGCAREAADFALTSPAYPWDWVLDSVAVPGCPPTDVVPTHRAIVEALKGGKNVAVSYKPSEMRLEQAADRRLADRRLAEVARVVYLVCPTD